MICLICMPSALGLQAYISGKSLVPMLQLLHKINTCMHIYKCPLYKNSDYDHQVNSLVGWISSLPHYCQMIRENNEWKRLLWCLQQTVNGEKFKDVIWSDECTVMIERKRKTYRRVGKPRKFKPKPKHPLKIHIWGQYQQKEQHPLYFFQRI